MNQEMFTITLLLESKFESKYGEKSAKYFLNLENQKGVNGTVEKIIKNYREVIDQLKIQHELRMFQGQLFKKIICNTNFKIVSFLDNTSLPVINNDFFKLCENDLTEDELLISLKSMQNNKLSGSDGLTKGFYETFWNEIRYVFLKSLKQVKENIQLSILPRQAVIKLIEKKIEIKNTLKFGDQYHYLTLIRTLHQKLSPQS